MKFGLREIILAVLLVSLPVGFWCFVLSPTNAEHAKLREEISLRQSKLHQLNRLVATVGSVKEEIASLDSAIASFRSKLPSKREIDKVLRETWRLAEANRLVTKSIQPGKTTSAQQNLYTTGMHAEQPLRIRLEGSFDGFYTFLQALENRPRIMRISKMNLLKPPDAAQGEVQASFEMVVFYEHADGE